MFRPINRNSTRCHSIPVLHHFPQGDEDPCARWIGWLGRQGEGKGGHFRRQMRFQKSSFLNHIISQCWWTASQHCRCFYSIPSFEKTSCNFQDDGGNIVKPYHSPTPPKFNSSSLKNIGWKTTFLLRRELFRGYVKLRGGNHFLFVR